MAGRLSVKPLDQFREEQNAIWDYIDLHYDGAEIFGEKVHQVMMQHAARASHHELPYALSVLTNLVACTNGAQTEIFPGTLSPIMLALFNSNYPQTRKSSGFIAGLSIGSELDATVLKKALAEVKEEKRKKQAQEGRGHEEVQVPNVKIESSILSNFTEAALYQRCSGDFPQVPPSDLYDLCGRLEFGTLVPLDEAHRFMKILGQIPNGKGQDAQGQTSDAASELNKLMQTGITSMTTKTAGSYGQGNAQPISMGLTGNLHPSMLVPMLRGAFGPDAVAVSYRLLFITGRPIEPHAGLPRTLQLEHTDFKRWIWPIMLPCMLEPLGLPHAAHRMEEAEAVLEVAVREHEDDESADEGEEEGHFNPNAGGYQVTLADGTMTRLRFKRKEGDSEWKPQLRVANRNVPIDEGMDLKALARRVLEHFEKPHMQILWNEEARLTMEGFKAVWNSLCAVTRD
jgi:hypothetical protein